MTGKILFSLAFVCALLCTSCNRKPSADFIIDKTQYAPGEIMYVGNRSLHAKSYKWTFPDGTSSASKDASYPIPENMPEGVYNVKLEATNGSKSSTSVKPIEVKNVTGQLTVWSSSSTFLPISVQVDGVPAGTITASYSFNPGCGAYGCVNINLKPGNHLVTATNIGGITTAGSTHINKDNCTVFRAQ